MLQDSKADLRPVYATVQVQLLEDPRTGVLVAAVGTGNAVSYGASRITAEAIGDAYDAYNGDGPRFTDTDSPEAVIREYRIRHREIRSQCAECGQVLYLAADGAWEDTSGACGCGDGEHSPEAD